MPRQSFLSTDFFVATSEENALEALAILPGQHPQISLVKENNHLHTTRFLFQHPEKSFQNYIDVSILPLNDQHVLFSLHGHYTNEKRIEDSSEIELAFACFEKSVYAALKIDYPLKEIKQKAISPSLKTIFRLPSTFLSTIFFKSA